MTPKFGNRVSGFPVSKSGNDEEVKGFHVSIMDRPRAYLHRDHPLSVTLMADNVAASWPELK